MKPLLLLLLLAGPAQAGERALPVGVELLEVTEDPQGGATKVNLDLAGASVQSVIRLLAEVGEINVVITDEIQGEVTARQHDVTWEDALATVLLSKGLTATTVPGPTPMFKVHPITP